MELRDLERIVRAALIGQSQPTLAAVAAGQTPDTMLDTEFADAVRSLTTRVGKPGKADDPNNWY